MKCFISFSGWSTRKEINKNQEKSFRTLEVLPSVQLKNREKTAHQLRTIQNTNSSETLTQKSALPPKKKLKISSTAGQQLSHSAHLCTIKEVEELSEISIPKDLNSDIYLLEEEESLSLRKSSLKDTSCDMPTEKSTLTQSNKSPVRKSLLDTTYVVPSVLDDKTNDIQISSDVQYKKTSPSPVKLSTKKRTLENSEKDSSNQPFNEEPEPKFGGLPVFPTNPKSTQDGLDNFLSKKLRLLEKRFSPSKDFSLSLSQETMMAKVNLKSIESQKNISKANGSLNSQVNICPQVNATAPLENEKVANIIPGPIEASANEKEDGSGAELSEKEYVEVASTISKTNVFEEESFVSQPIPCGQPLPKDQTRPLTQVPITHQPSVKESLAEKASTPSTEKYSNQVEAQELILVKESKVGRKRKHKSKGESTSRKPPGVKSMVVIQYSAVQIQNMIEIMKNIQSET